jgi:acetolactate synthase-1/2/3 large subunit
MATCAEVIAEFLHEAGVRRIYGVPGEGASLSILEAARRRRIQFVLAHRPAAAAIMAATEGELLGRPGVCLLAQGPGVAGAVDGVAHAVLDQAPLLVLAERPSRLSRRLGARQALDQVRLLDGVARESATLSAARTERLLRWAWDRAGHLPRGPVHLDIPADQAARSARRRGLAPEPEAPRAPSAHAVRAAARLLAHRGRALTVAGLGSRSDATSAALLELVEHLGTPVFTTEKAKGVIPEDHPLAAGVFWGGRLEEELVGKADALLAVGLESVELLPRAWRPGTPVVVLSDAPSGPRPYQATAEVAGDLTRALEALRAESPPGGEWSRAGWAGVGGKFKARARVLLLEAGTAPGEGLAPPRVVQMARTVFPRETVATVDGGAHGLVASLFWESYDRKGYLCSSGLGASGFALPAAVAAKLNLPERPVIAFTGDGGLLHSLSDIAVAARLSLPLVVVVFLDGSLSLIRAAQEQRKYAPDGVALGAVDVARLAEGVGALGTEVSDEADLQKALEDALGATQPALIGVRVRGQTYRKMLEILRGRETS